MICLLITKIKKMILGQDHLYLLSDFSYILSGPMERTFLMMIACKAIEQN